MHLLHALGLVAVLLALVWVGARAVYSAGFQPILRRYSGIRFVGPALFHLLMLPGTAVHETSHWLACKLMLVRVHEFAPYHPQRDGTMGWVLHDRADPIRGLVIAVAPVIGGTLVLAAAVAALAPGIGTFPRATTAELFVARLISWTPGAVLSLDFGAWQTWLLFYLGATIGRGMVPSPSDLAPVLTGFGALLAASTIGALTLQGMTAGPAWDAIAAIVEQAFAEPVERAGSGLAVAVLALSLSAAVAVPLGSAAGFAGRAFERAPRSTAKRRR